MPPQLKRHARAVRKGGRFFLASLGRLAVFLTTRKRGWGISLTFALGLLIFGAGAADKFLLPRMEQDADGHTDARVAVPGEERASFSALDLLGARTATLARYVGAGAVTAPTTTVTLPLPDGRTITCTDLSKSLPSTGNPASWERSGPIKHITIHSAGVAGDTDPYAVANYHVYSNGWGHIGYSWIVRRTGACFKTLPDGVLVYAQILGNPNDAAIMLSGNSDYPPDQLAALTDLTVALASQYSVPPSGIKFHCDWSMEDQAAARAGTWSHASSLINSHVDPYLRLSDCVGSDHFGLREAVASSVNSSPPVPPTLAPVAGDLGTYSVPALAVRSQFVGTATYYLPTGRPSASGQPYTGTAHTGAVWLLTRDQLADDDPRARDCHVSPTLGATVCPAVPWTTVVRICRTDNKTVCSRASIIDTGLMKSNEIDLSPVVFQELGVLREGRISVSVTIVGYLRP